MSCGLSCRRHCISGGHVRRLRALRGGAGAYGSAYAHVSAANADCLDVRRRRLRQQVCGEGRREPAEAALRTDSRGAREWYRYTGDVAWVRERGDYLRATVAHVLENARGEKAALTARGAPNYRMELRQTTERNCAKLPNRYCASEHYLI